MLKRTDGQSLWDSQDLKSSGISHPISKDVYKILHTSFAFGHIHAVVFDFEVVSLQVIK